MDGVALLHDSSKGWIDVDGRIHGNTGDILSPSKQIGRVDEEGKLRNEKGEVMGKKRE